MPTQITTGTSDFPQRAIYRMPDAKLVAIWFNNGSSVQRSTSSDNGATWTVPAAVTGLNGSGVLASCTDGAGNIYGAIGVAGSTTSPILAFKMAYAAGAFTDTNAAINLLTNPNGDIRTGVGMAACWDSVKSTVHIAAQWADSGNTYDLSIVALNTALAKIAQGFLQTSLVNQAGNLAAVADTAATPNIYLLIGQSATPANQMQLVPMTWSGTAYTTGATETVNSGNFATAVAIALDQSANLDIFYIANGTTALVTKKRTGVNTYSAVTTLVASGADGAGGLDGSTVSVARTGNANADIYVFYRNIGTQPNGEIHYVKRAAGAWVATALFAGGATTTWTKPAAIDLIQADGKAHLLYRTGPTTFALIYDNLQTATAPSAPINVLPTGNGNTNLTPTISCTYKNTNSSDPVGSSQILVTRQSDSVVMWDTGQVTYTGPAIQDGGTFSKLYAGTALAKGITYLLQVRFWDQNGGLIGPYSAAVTFQINDPPVVTITSSATPSVSGPTITWTYSQGAAHAQASYRVLIKDATDASVIYDSTVIASAATSAAVPNGTLANGVTYKLHLVVLSVDNL